MSKQVNDYWGPKMLSGVEFVFKKKLVLPSYCPNSLPSVHLNSEYDFNVENSILAKLQIQQTQNHHVSKDTIEIKEPTKNTSYRFETINTILKPQKVVPSQISSFQSQPNVEIKDFENIEDPFEMAELKTIDDKKELQLLLENNESLHSQRDVSLYNINAIQFPVIKSKSAIDNFSKSAECSVSRSFRM